MDTENGRMDKWLLLNIKPHNHPDISKEMPPAQHLQCCLYHLSWKVVKVCIFLDRGGKLVRDKRASRSSLMAFSLLHVLTHNLACPFFTMAETLMAIPFFLLNQYLLCASLILCFHLLLYIRSPPATPSIKKFTSLNSTNPSKHPERSCSKDM